MRQLSGAFHTLLTSSFDQRSEDETGWFFLRWLILLCDNRLVAKPAREKQAATAATPQQTASDKEANQAALVIAIVLVVILVFSSLPGPAAEQVREKEAAQTVPAQHTAPDQ